mmetsp:Transcript_72983/g.194805  ORF Transcript_72983/g.194805 Transcript_72983/m.194805 type:complete len:227 (+) Transcript_72983:1267-1947(+)
MSRCIDLVAQCHIPLGGIGTRLSSPKTVVSLKPGKKRIFSSNQGWPLKIFRAGGESVWLSLHRVLWVRECNKDVARFAIAFVEHYTVLITQPLSFHRFSLPSKPPLIPRPDSLLFCSLFERFASSFSGFPIAILQQGPGAHTHCSPERTINMFHGQHARRALDLLPSQQDHPREHDDLGFGGCLRVLARRVTGSASPTAHLPERRQAATPRNQPAAASGHALRMPH